MKAIFSLSPTAKLTTIWILMVLNLSSVCLLKDMMSEKNNKECRKGSCKKSIDKKNNVEGCSDRSASFPNCSSSLKTELFKAKVESTTMNPLVTAEFETTKRLWMKVIALIR